MLTVALRSGEIPMRLEPGLAVNLRTGERRDVAQLSNIVAMAGIGHPPRFCHAESMWCQRAKALRWQTISL